MQCSSKVKYLGAILYENLSIKEHVTSKCRTATWNIQRIKQMRSSISQDACETLVLSLVMSHLDYSNILFIGLPSCDLDKLQRVQNIAAKLVLRDGDNSHSSLKRLHWLPIRLRVQHKTLTLVYRSLHGQAPKYISELLQEAVPTRSGLRSETSNSKLKEPFTRKKTFADRAFSVAAPKWWNELPDSVKNCDTVDSFKAKLKTHLFDKF